MGTLKENFKTQAGSVGQDGTRKLTRSWYAYDYATLKLADEAVSVEAEGTTSIGGVNVTWNGARSWSRIDGVNEAWNFSAEYSTAISAPDETDQETAAFVNGTATATTKLMYRTNFFLGDVDIPSGADVGGSPIDSGGQPTSVVVIERRFETTVYYGAFPQINSWALLVGKRNEGGYEGAAAGTVLYLGFSFSYNPSNTTWEVKHQFSVDAEFSHTLQVAQTDSNGKVITDLFETTGGTNLYVAKHVYLVQPFGTVSFTSLPDFPE
jgi:hypothetical protein